MTSERIRSIEYKPTERAQKAYFTRINLDEWEDEHLDLLICRLLR
jgi:hypothetical protein